MGPIEWILGIAILAIAVFLVLAVLMQSGKDKKLSGSITGGGSDTYFGKNKGRSWDKVLSRATIVLSIVFAVLVVVAYVYVSKIHA